MGQKLNCAKRSELQTEIDCKKKNRSEVLQMKMKNYICCMFSSGNSPASEFCMPTFRKKLSVPSS
jgi:hypothetical protein